MERRRTYLAQIGEIYFAVEGGPGTVDECTKVLQMNENAVLIPIYESGGASSGMFFSNPDDFFNSVETRMSKYCNNEEKAQMLKKLYKSQITEPESVIKSIFDVLDTI